MSQPPGPYERSYSFTDFSTNNPNTQQPGQKIDQELNNVRTALNATQDRLEEVQADDGKIRESALRMETLGPAVSPYVTPSALSAINAAGSAQVSAVNAAGSAQVSLVDTAGDIALGNLNSVINSTAATNAVNAANAASASASAAAGSASAASTSAGQASGYKSSAQASASSASGSAAAATAAANAAVNYQSAAISAIGECQTLVTSAQSAASLAEYWNGLAQDASASAGSSTSSASGAAIAAAASAGNAASSAGDASVSAGVAGLAATAAATSATNAATSATNAAASAASITPFTGGAVTTAISLVSDVYHTWFDVGEIYGFNTTDDSFFDLSPNHLVAGDGTDYVMLTTAGVRFADGTVQATAATGGGSGSYLPLAGGTMTGNITFDGTSGQFIGKGQFDTSRGGNYGISLVCSIGYEFNWQAGWLTATAQSSTAPRPLHLDSLAGTTLRVWNSATDNGVEVSHTGIKFADGSEQTSASSGSGGGSVTGESLVVNDGNVYVVTNADNNKHFIVSSDTPRVEIQFDATLNDDISVTFTAFNCHINFTRTGASGGTYPYGATTQSYNGYTFMPPGGTARLFKLPATYGYAVFALDATYLIQTPPPAGTILYDGCVMTPVTDASGYYWSSAAYQYERRIANGIGGQNGEGSIYSINSNGCYYPSGFVISRDNNNGYITEIWLPDSSTYNPNFGYNYTADTISNGSGGSYVGSPSYTYPSYGTYIYQWSGWNGYMWGTFNYYYNGSGGYYSEGPF